MKILLKIISITGICIFCLWVIFASSVTIWRIIELKQKDEDKFLALEKEKNDCLQGYYYSDNIGKDLYEKFLPADTNFLRLHSANNKAYDDRANPKSFIPPDSAISSFTRLYEKWPGFLKEFSKYHILAVFTVENLGSSGITYEIRDGNNEDYIIGIDRSVFTQHANEWATEKLKSAFCGNPDISVKIEDKERNSIERTLEMILLHEIGHAFGTAKGHIPTWFEARIPQENADCFAVLKGAFFIKYANIKRRMPLFQVFDSLSFYGSAFPCRNANEADSLFVLLSKSPYPTLYSSQNAYEYYADAFASYIHCVIQGREYEVKIGNNVYRNGITEDRCKNLRDFFSKEFMSAPRIGKWQNQITQH